MEVVKGSAPSSHFMRTGANKIRIYAYGPAGREKGEDVSEGKGVATLKGGGFMIDGKGAGWERGAGERFGL